LPSTRVLFVPVSGGAGSGEVQRCRLLAQALRARWPQVDPRFLLAPGVDAAPFATNTLSASPTRVPDEVRAAIAALQPALVVFDGNARVATLAAARDAGARTLLVSSRPSARDRGFRLRRMAQLDAHWLVGAELRGAPGWRERLARWRYPRVEVRRFATLFAPPASAASLLARLGLTADFPFAVVCAGGGGHADAGMRFAEVATQLARGGIATIAVGVPASSPAITVPALANAELMGLLAAARVALLAGGSLLVQALALDVPVVGVPLQAEQAARVRWLAQAGALQAGDAHDPAHLAQRLQALVDDDAARNRLRAGVAALGLENGLDAAVDALATLAGLAPQQRKMI
jgi:hypothetical protein